MKVGADIESVPRFHISIDVLFFKMGKKLDIGKMHICLQPFELPS